MQSDNNQPITNQPSNTAGFSAPANNITNTAQPIQNQVQAYSQSHLDASRVNSLQNTYANNIDSQGNFIQPQSQSQPQSNQTQDIQSDWSGQVVNIHQDATQQPQDSINTVNQNTPIQQQLPQNQPQQATLQSSQTPSPQLQQPQPQFQPQPQPQLQPNQAPQQQKPTPKTREQASQEATAQNSLLISEIRDNMIILNDGTFRAVIACDSINYDLMSGEERDGIEYSYQQFLNTLYFPVQIIVQSRKIDLKPYTDKLERIRSQQENMLLGILMDEYIDFIFDISEQANIMEKNFFIVVPFSLNGEIDSAVNSFKNLSDGVLSSIQKKENITINNKDYAKVKDELNNRVNTVVNGLMNIGVRAGRLPTQAINMLYYNFYNPDTALNEPINDFGKYNGIYTRQGEGEATMPGMEVL